MIIRYTDGSTYEGPYVDDTCLDMLGQVSGSDISVVVIVVVSMSVVERLFHVHSKLQLQPYSLSYLQYSIS